MSPIDSLVLGASGNVGLALLKRLLEKGERVVGTYFGYRPTVDKVDFFRADISGAESARLIDRFAPRKVYHLAWGTNLDECESRPELAYGPAREGLAAILKACSAGGAHLIFMSSDGIFGDPTCERYEDSEPCPINHYGRGKVEAERRIQESGTHWSILRACPVGLNPLRERGLVNWAVRSLRDSKPIRGFADSSFTPVSVRTLSTAIASIGKERRSRILHFLSDPPVSKYDFLRALARELRIDPSCIAKGSLQEAAFAASRPSRQDLQTHFPDEGLFSVDQEVKLSIS